MSGSLLNGAAYLSKGAKLMTKPGVRPFVLIPLLVNILLFSAMIYFAFQQTSAWINALMAWLPGWLDFLDWALWFVFAIIVFVVLIFSFTLVANFIAAPFNGFLSAAVERHLTGKETQDSGRSIAAEVLHSIVRELAKLGYYLPRLLLIFVLAMIPPITLIAPFLWFFFGAWMLALQYIDYPMDNHGVGFRQMKTELKTQRLTSIGFGSITLFAMMVPVLNFFVMPAAVAGATALYVEQNGEN